MVLAACLAIASGAGCVDSHDAVVGSWATRSDHQLGGCENGFFYSDVVDVTITGLQPATTAPIAQQTYACDDRGFALDIPNGYNRVRVEVHAWTTDDSGEHLDTGGATVDVAVNGDTDVGTLRFQ